MTDQGKYHYTESDQYTNKEWTLKKNLQDAELLIQELKVFQQEDKDRIKLLEERLKHKDSEN